MSCLDTPRAAHLLHHEGAVPLNAQPPHAAAATAAETAEAAAAATAAAKAAAEMLTAGGGGGGATTQAPRGGEAEQQGVVLRLVVRAVPEEAVTLPHLACSLTRRISGCESSTGSDVIPHLACSHK